MRLNARGLGAFAAAGMILLGLTGGALAQEVENLGTEWFWTAWKGSDNTGVICYVSSQPQPALPCDVNRDPTHFLVPPRKGLGPTNEVQTLVGHPRATDNTPSVTIDGRALDMVVDGSA